MCFLFFPGKINETKNIAVNVRIWSNIYSEIIILLWTYNIKYKHNQNAISQGTSKNRSPQKLISSYMMALDKLIVQVFNSLLG